MASRYRELLRTPGAPGLVGFGFLGRLSDGVVALPIVALGDDVSGTVLGGGVALGTYGLGVALGAPTRGRALDRLGAGALLPWLVVAHVAGLLICATSTLAGGAAALVAGALVAGAAFPSLPAAMRLEWRRSLGADRARLERAYAFESATQVAVFVLGPLVAGGLLWVGGPALALVAAAACLLLGGLAFAGRCRSAPSDRRRRPALDVLGQPGVRALLAIVICADVSIGATQVATTAFAQARGSVATVGLLVSLGAVSALVGVLLVGGRDWESPGGPLRDPRRRLRLALVACAVCAAPLAAAATTAQLAVLLVLAGLPYAVQWALTVAVLDDVAPAGGGAEAYSWLSTGSAAGIAIGSVVAGALADTVGPAGGLAVVAVGFAAAATVAVVALREPRGLPAVVGGVR